MSNRTIFAFAAVAAVILAAAAFWWWPDASHARSSPSPAAEANACAPAGCSGQLCVDAKDAPNIVTTCEFRPEYACYRQAVCARQADGRCGWSDTEELRACLQAPPRD